MKQIIFLFLLLVFTATSFCQQSSTLKVQANTDYLKKSKTQKTFAWILTGVGVTAIAIAASTQSYVDAFTGIANEKNTASPAVYAVGGACIAGGVVLFIAAAKNKRKANAAVFIKKEMIPSPAPGRFSFSSVPVAGIRLAL